MSLKLPTPESFPAFPYDPPYSIQVDLMRHLYSSIEEKKVTIVESPTGTGKTLSLLCASLTWLSDEKNRAKKGKLAALASGDELDWVVAQTVDRQKRELEADEREYEERLANARKKEALLKKLAKGRVNKKPKLSDKRMEPESDDESFLPEASKEETDDANISPAVRALMEKLNKGHARDASNQDTEPTCTKIYYASRTHSQLTQILPELRKLKLSPLPPVTSASGSSSHHVSGKRQRDEELQEAEECMRSYTRTVTLGSRKQLCINDELRAKARDLDEGCRELLGEKQDKRCQYLPSAADDHRMIDFRDQILASPKDIEDLASAGRIAHTCPYFGSRRAIPQAELVTLPYNLLLQKTAREALGIDLTDQIVIIDEAHNLISTLLSLSTTRLPIRTLSTSLEQVSIYWSKFRNRLSPTHALHIKRLIAFLVALKNYAAEWKQQTLKNATGDSKVEVMAVGELVQRLGRKVEGINLLEVEGYLRSSKIARKIAGYSDKLAEKAQGHSKSIHASRGAMPPLHIVEAFMLSLVSANDDGRVAFCLTGASGQEDVEMKYQLLNPATHFREVVDSVRCVVLAGGTMSPMSDFSDQLFSHLPSERLSTFSCGHITPSSNLLTLVVSKGPRGGDLNFKYERQNDPALISELGQILLNFVNIVPAGLVVFLPSYRFLNTVKSAWDASGMLEKCNKKKRVFWEPQDGANVEAILHEYAAEMHCIAQAGKRPGALLFAVIGAKLSEGLNFSDDLARAVVIIGLPFANMKSPELQERLKYVNRLSKNGDTDRSRGSKDAASQLYENLCMNSVNQSIGRAIRHQRDWASLILIDARYMTSTVHQKLPGWIGVDMVITQNFGHAIRHMGKFYQEKALV